MTDYLSILRSVYSGLSQRQAAATHRVSRNTVALLVRYAKDRGWLALEDLNALDNAVFWDGIALDSGESRDATFRMPDFEYVHSELAKPHVTLKLLWEEYVQACRQNGDQFYMETQFRHYYHKFARVHKATIRLVHKPALSMEVDWAGTKIGFIDSESGNKTKASLFVSVLPCSQIIFVEPFRDEQMHSWIAGHVHAFEYFGGVPKTLVSDNLKSGVKHPSFYEPILNKTYQDLATHYGTVVLPARVRKPKDKPSVENSVRIASRRILARLRNTQIVSFSDLQQYIRLALEDINQQPLSGKSESRWTSYLAEEKDYMLSLPGSRFEMAHWAKAKVQPNCHVVFERKFYSVPFEHLGEYVDIRATQQVVEIFYHHRRIASHKRLWGKTDYATQKEHMPPDKTFFTDWDRDRFLTWADKIGNATRQVIMSILDRAVIEQQAYRACFGVLGLKQEYGAQRLERACNAVLSLTSSPTYRQLKSVLQKESAITEQPKPERTMNKAAKRGFQRGARYFGGDEHAQ